MTTSSTLTPDADRRLAEVLHRVWGFSDFRPLQREAMHAVLQSRDSVVVLPTGGGKSLCFQAPAIVDPAPRIADLGLRIAEIADSESDGHSTQDSAVHNPKSEI